MSKAPAQSNTLRKWWVMLGIGISVLMYTFDTNIVNIALPTLLKTFNTNFATIQWVVLSYLLVISTLVLSVARLGDIFVKKYLYLGGLIIFTFSSLLCGLAANVFWLIGFRALQGLGAVFISALGAAIIVENFPSSERGRGLGIISAVVLLGTALGPVVGGIIVEFFSWRTLFLINVPIGILTTFIVAKNIPNTAEKPVKQSFDGLGAMFMSVTLISFALAMTYGQNQGFDSKTTLILFAVATVGLICFLYIETHIKQPMIDLHIFKNLQFSLGLVTALLVCMIISSVILITPFFLELVLHYSTEQVGLLLAVLPVLGGLISPISGALSDRFQPHVVSLMGLLMIMLGCLLVTTFNAQMTELDYIIRIVPFSLGIGLFQSPNNSAVLGSISPQKLGIASGLLSLTRTLGQSIGLPLMSALFVNLSLISAQLNPSVNITDLPVEAIVFGMQGTFRVAALIMFASALLMASFWKLENSSTLQRQK